MFIRADSWSSFLLHGIVVLVPGNTEGQTVNRVLQTVNTLFCRVFHRLDVLRPCTLPRTGAAILICNHTSGLDPLLIQSICPRMIVWMMAKEYYDLRGLKKVYKTIEAIPVDRNGRDMAATRAALRALQNGRILGVFPEGKIEHDHALLPFQAGIALLAAKSRAPIYPSYLDGTQRNKAMVAAVMTPQHAAIAFGPALHPITSGTRVPLDAEAERYRTAVSVLKKIVDDHRRIARPSPANMPNA